MENDKSRGIIAWTQRYGAFFGLVIAVAGIIIVVAIFIAGRSKSEVTFRGVSKYSLVDIDPTVLKEIEVRYKGKKISNLTKFVFELDNTGKRDIDGEDIRKPIRWHVPEGGTILSAKLLSLSPVDTDTFIQVLRSPQEVGFDLTVLNSDMSAQFEVVCANNVSDEARISGLVSGSRIVDRVNEYQLRAPNVIERVFADTLGVNVLRWLVHSLLFLFIVLLFVFTYKRIDRLNSKRKRRKERRLSREWLLSKNLEPHEIDEDLMRVAGLYRTLTDQQAEELTLLCNNSLQGLYTAQSSLPNLGADYWRLHAILDMEPREPSFRLNSKGIKLLERAKLLPVPPKNLEEPPEPNNNDLPF